ncbi:MAG: SDR family NAD(P)-dependent oxidoreductase [Flavitalea sp.]
MSICNLFDLSGKTALVTGCSKGIGMGYAVALAKAGADIVAVSRTFEPGELDTLIQSQGRKLSKYVCDIGNREALYATINEIRTKEAPIDILINNAGIILRMPAAEHSDEYWDKVIDVNLNAQFIITREFGKEMISRKSGKIVFTCSMLSYQGGINVPGYTASKSAVAGLVRAFANEWAKDGVNVNGIAPGYIATNNTLALREDADRSKTILDRIPAGRWGVPEDFEGPVVFLCSKAADYVNGAILNVDGGWMAR